MSLRVIFMGSPAFAVPSLRALHAAGHEITAVYTQPPRPKGRGQQVQPTDVQLAAENLGLGDRVRCPARLRDEALDELLATPCDVICVVAYGLLLPKALVDSRVCLNVHPSALPRWRGAAPLQWTLLSGDKTSELCVMRLDEGMDTGPVYCRIPLTVEENDTYGQLHDRAAAMGASALVDVVARLSELTPLPQNSEGATHARKLTKDDARLDLSRSALEIHNTIRALTPSPHAFLEHEGVRIKVRGSRLGEGRIERFVGASLSCSDDEVWVAEALRPGEGWRDAAEVLG
ncbi:MAG: methionyl-tRNA formyltransferase [Alphaproteobacteria bacterium CG_4_10_14_0_8_um_filter_53_9]|nr:MAG: methionyl-tRNA formyltransferase [Alphaproteobacteria bacterium CG_4_10_14_0_8_um_filter_53_9]